MKGLNFLIRLVIALVAFYFLCILWVMQYYFNDSLELQSGFLSVFFGTSPPSGTVRNLVLLSRFLLGIMVTLFVFIPGLTFFVDFAASAYARTIAVFLTISSVVVFFVALVLQQLFYI